MSHKPLVSIVMPNYNCARFIGEAIESILQQTFHDFEFIIVDDGSVDDSWKIICAYAQTDARIIAVQNEENLKICRTLSKGIQMAKGTYIARMDSDDVAHVDWLEKMVRFMEMKEHAHIGVCGANFYLIDQKGKKIGQKIFPETDRQCRDAFWFRNPFAHNTVIIRKECFSTFGFYDQEFLYAEDLELWMRFGQKYQLHNIQEFLVDYRISGENSVLKKQRTMIQNTLKARKKAKREYGYHMSFKGYVFYWGTWTMQFLPPRFVFWMFNFLKK